jgi:REP element-mobilizing transposase RayT
MTNHVHLPVTLEREHSLPRTMPSVGRRHARTINTAYRRTGTLREGRTRAAPIDPAGRTCGIMQNFVYMVDDWVQACRVPRKRT